MLRKFSVSLLEVLLHAGRTIFSKYVWHQNEIIASNHQISTAPLPLKQNSLAINVFYSSLVSLLSEIELFWNFEKATKRYPMQSVKLHPSLTSLTWQSMMFSVFQHRFVNCQSSTPNLSQSKSSKQDHMNKILAFIKWGSWIFFRVTLKAFIRTRMTVWTIQNDYFDHVRHL